MPQDLPDSKMDNRILKVCIGIKNDNKDMSVILVTKDILLRIKAQILDIQAQDYTTDQAPEEEKQYTRRKEIFVEEDAFKEFKKKGIECENVYQVDNNGIRKLVNLEVNEFLILKADQSTKKTQLGVYDGKRIVPLKYKKSRPFGVKPRNVGQYFLKEALLTNPDEVPIVIVKGMAGTAKTFYSIAVGLEKVYNAESKEYRKILISRPNVQFDDSIGFLPGSEQEKIAPLIRPIIDNLEQIIDSDEEERYKDEEELKGKIDELFERGIIVAEALNFVRGRSFVNTYLIIDEAQNMTPKQVIGVITRAGKGTKVILLGEPKQIDNPYLDEKTNGLTYASEHMKGSKLCYQVTLTAEKCERSELAKIAGFMHDIGNSVNRNDHAHNGAIMAFSILRDLKMLPSDIALIISAIGNHDENTGTAVTPISAAIILADKTDVRRNRVRNTEIATFDKHDRVNYAVLSSDLITNIEKKTIHLDITLDEMSCSVLDYFEIFLERMLMCRRASEVLGMRFKFTVNGNKVL